MKIAALRWVELSAGLSKIFRCVVTYTRCTDYRRAHPQGRSRTWYYVYHRSTSRKT